MKTKAEYTYGLVLSGGGARGFAHLGAVKALEENNIKPGIISGVSAGAIMGAFLAAGKTAEETHEILKSHRFLDISKIQFPKQGLFNMHKLGAVMQSAIGNINLEELPLPLVIAATNILDARIEYFTKGNLSKLVEASASIPVIFSPVEIDGKYYVDGGVFRNVPTDPVRAKCEYLIAVNISPMERIANLGNILDIAARTFQLSVNSATLQAEKICDLYLEPPELAKFPIFDASHADKLFDIGYHYTRERLSTFEFEKKAGVLKKISDFFKNS